jgi:membrane protein
VAGQDASLWVLNADEIRLFDHYLMEQVDMTSSQKSPGRFRNWLDLLRTAAKYWSEDNALRLSAALAYYSIFSLAPLLIITLGIAGLVLDDEAATGQIYGGLKSYVGVKAAETLQAMVESASKPRAGIIATVVGSVTLLIGASGLLGQLKDALNTIWEVKLKPGGGIGFFIRSKFLNFGMVLVIGLLLLISLLLSTFLTSLNQSFSQVIEMPAWIWTGLALLTSLGVETVLFALLFKVLPDARIRWRDVWLGAAITAVLFEIGKFALSWYLGRESTADAYGPAASVVLLILWVYYASCILLFGAEFTQVWAASTGHVIQPSAHAVSTANEPPAGAPAVARQSATPEPEQEPEPYQRSHAAKLQAWQASPFSHRLLAPLLKYLEGRGLLLSIEAKAALGQAAVILILAAVCCVAAFVAWTLLALALVGLLTSQFDWFWVKAVAVTGGVHLLAVLLIGLLIWWKATHGAWFSETLNEIKKDRQWLRGTSP